MFYSNIESENKIPCFTRIQFFLFLLISIFVLNNSGLNAQTLAPLYVGNMWVYQENDTSRKRVKFFIADTITIDSNKYFICKQSGQDSVVRYFRLREDGVYVMYNKGREYPYFKTNFAKNDTMYHREWYGRWSFIVKNETAENLFGLNVTVKDIFINLLFNRSDERWTEEFGLVFGVNIYGNSYSILKGCVVNGTVYGDTTTVITGIKEELPESSFALSQNYPNPFNPATYIQYSVPYYTNVTIEIFDVIGRRISTLLNEQQNAGSYNVVFDGSKINSGIYFYKITAGKFVQIKKMILMK